MTNKAAVLWLTGLSGSGKTTIAVELVKRLHADGFKAKIIDGDDVRQKNHPQLGFSNDDIAKNNELISQMCVENIKNFDVIIVPVIAPFLKVREKSRRIIGHRYVEVFVKAKLDTVIKRDVKGLYKKALNGEINNFIGISASTPYEEPVSPEMIIDTDRLNLEESVEAVMKYIKVRLFSQEKG